jgi:pimeloyl-ACP methyl ester carboxylesterase
VVAPDHRGYGRSGGTDVTFDDSLWPFRPMERVRDTLGLVYALGYREVAMIVGQDFGSSVSSWSTLIRPDVFRSMVLMTAPFEGAPSFPFNTANEPPKPAPSGPTVHDDLAALPQPRKHYHWYNARREANAEWMGAKQGVHDFLRAYFHVKPVPFGQPVRLGQWEIVLVVSHSPLVGCGWPRHRSPHTSESG